MTIRIGKIVANGNGADGVRVEGNAEIEIGELYAANNGGQGVAILRHAPFLGELGLPGDIDPVALAQLLQQLQSVPFEDRPQVVSDTGFLSRFGDSVAMIRNVVEIAANPSVAEFIRRLSI